MKEVVLTGIKASGEPHLGNYVGAIRPAIQSVGQGNQQCFFFVADYHALTSTHDPKELQKSVLQISSTWLACGLDPEKAWFYRQSDIPEIFELTWVLMCHIPKGDLNRAHAYKAAVQNNQELNRSDLDQGVNAGLFNYPVLMAADILCFDAAKVPVGKDQIQHIEMARSMAQRINHIYGDCLTEPQEMIDKTRELLVGLDGRKMSKSYGNSIPMFLPQKKLQKMINKIKTDSSAPGEPKNPEESHIFEMYRFFASEEEVSEFSNAYKNGISWGEAKAQLFQVIDREVASYRDKYEDYMAHPERVEEILQEGAKKARPRAREVLDRVKSCVVRERASTLRG